LAATPRKLIIVTVVQREKPQILVSTDREERHLPNFLAVNEEQAVVYLEPTDSSSTA
jgi:hypothetical protein